MDEERCHIGTAPTLADSLHEYGRECVLSVIDEILYSLVTFTSARVQLSQEQRGRLAWVVLTQYPRMRITELILSVVKAQSGKFGKFYDRIDPIDITTALTKWWSECQQLRNEYRLALYVHEQETSRDESDRIHRANIDKIRTMLLNGLCDPKKLKL
jgi:hypothetical protein